MCMLGKSSVHRFTIKLGHAYFSLYEVSIEFLISLSRFELPKSCVYDLKQGSKAVKKIFSSIRTFYDYFKILSIKNYAIFFMRTTMLSVLTFLIFTVLFFHFKAINNFKFRESIRALILNELRREISQQFRRVLTRYYQFVEIFIYSIEAIFTFNMIF